AQLAAADLRGGGARRAGPAGGVCRGDVLFAQGGVADQGGAGAARFWRAARRAARADARRKFRGAAGRRGVRALRDGSGVSRAAAQARGGSAVTPLENIARFPRDLVVRAGAGTGKTHALVTLYLH